MEIGKFKLAKADLVRPPNKPAQEQIIPKQKPYTEKVFKLEVDDFIKGFIGGFPKDEMLLKIQSVLDKAVDAGAIEPQEGIKYLRERKQQLVDFARENYGQELPGIEEDRKDFAIGGGAIEGEDLGSRIGFAGPKLIKQGPDKGKYVVRYRDKQFGKREGQKGYNEGNTPPMTKEEAEKFYNERQAKLGELKGSGQKIKILEQTEQINNFVNNFFDKNINKYSARDYDKFEKNLVKEFKKAKIQSLGKGGRNILRHGLPNVGAKDSKLPFNKYNIETFLSQGENAEKAYKNYFKKLFFSGKIETDENLRKGINDFLNYEISDKRKSTFNAPENIDEVIYLVADNKTGTGKFRSNIIKKYFPETMDKYIKKKGRSSDLYNQKRALIENKLGPEKLKEILGETSIEKFMRKQSNILKEVFDVSALEPGLHFNLDHAEGIAEIANMENKEDIARALKNLIGMTSARNYELGWRGYSTKRKALLNNINQGTDVDKNLQELNDLTKSVYPEVKGKDAYKMVNNKIVPTKDFNFTYQPENAFKQYFTELTSTPRSLEVLKSQYEKNPKFKEFIQKDPELTSKIDETYNKMIDVFQNPKFKSVLKNSGLTLRGLGQMRKGNIPGFLSTMEKLMQKNPDLRAELEYDFSDIQNQYASASMMSDVSPVRKEQESESLPAEALAAGTVGATKYGPQILKALKNVGKVGLKTVGSLPAAVGFAGLETKAGMDEGKSFVDAVTDPMVGLNLLLPETVKKLGPLMAKGARISTPVGATITGIGTLKNRAQNMIRKAEELAAMQPNEEQQNLIEEYAAKDYKGYYNQGGRVNFADGPEDPSKRKFMKIAGGLASLPIIGRFFDVAQVAEKATPAVIESAKGIPDFIFDLVAKVKAKAVEKGMKYFTGNKADEFEDVYQADNFIVKEKGNKITIREIDDPDRPGYRENQIEIDVDPETGKMTYNEASVRPDDEGKLKDVEEFIDDMDLENMKKYTYDE